MTLISDILTAHQEAIGALKTQESLILRIGLVLVDCLRGNHRIFLCGNGGSAADAQHIAAEMVCRFETQRRGLPAIALTTDTSALTAISNDFGFERIFARQVEALARAGDVLVALSTSGNSRNVVEAVKAAQSNGVICVGLLGSNGGTLNRMVEHPLLIPSDVTARIQECHILVGHIWCALIDAAFT
jgi:D-sedoheptulose 7-phosphate isomerase